MELALTALDRLVALVDEQGGHLPAERAAEALFALVGGASGSEALLRPLVRQDSRLAWRDGVVRRRDPGAAELDAANYVVFDLETTGLAGPGARICEIGAVRLHGTARVATFETLVAPGVALPARVGRLTGLAEPALAQAPPVEVVLERFLAFAQDATLVAHNARFDLGFVNRELARSNGTRLACVTLDTVHLARRLLDGRAERLNLAALATFFGVPTTPCHRALPDACATAEVFACLVELARDAGATTVAALGELAAPQVRRRGSRSTRRSPSARRHTTKAAPGVRAGMPEGATPAPSGVGPSPTAPPRHPAHAPVRQLPPS